MVWMHPTVGAMPWYKTLNLLVSDSSHSNCSSEWHTPASGVDRGLPGRLRADVSAGDAGDVSETGGAHL